MTTRRVILMVMGLAMLACGCSKSERKEAAPAPVRMPPAADVVAPAPEQGGVVTQAVQTTVHPRLNKPNPETMRAARERGDAFVRNAVEKALKDVQVALEEAERKVMEQELTLRKDNPEVNSRWVALLEKRRLYDEERIKIPGMVDLWKEREAAKTRLKAADGSKATPDDEINASRDALRRLGKTMIELELKARSDNPLLVAMLTQVKDAEDGYRMALSAVPEFAAMEKNQKDLLAQHEMLLERQADLSRKEK